MVTPRWMSCVGATVALLLSLPAIAPTHAVDSPDVTEAFRSASLPAQTRQGHTVTPTASLLPAGGTPVVSGMGAAGIPTAADQHGAAARLGDADGRFSPAGSLTDPRYGHAATLLSDGRVLVMGGWGERGLLDSAEVWDPATATFAPAGSLAGGRSMHTATALPDGRVLVIGASSSYDPLASTTEAWDPATASFAPAASLETPRAEHTATALPDGRVLVVGGGYDDGRASAVVWVVGDRPVDPAAAIRPGGATSDDHRPWLEAGATGR